MAKRVAVTVNLPPTLIERIDQEIRAAEAAQPGAKMSRSSWSAARIAEFFAVKDQRAAARGAKKAGA